MGNQSHSISKWSIELRGEEGVVEFVLSDIQGRRASRIIRDGNGVIEIIRGWGDQYSCDATHLFVNIIPSTSELVRQTLGKWLKELNQKRFTYVGSTALQRLSELAENPYRPEPIRRINEEIAAETRVAKIRAEVTGQIDQQQIDQIVDMKLHRDGLYCDWANGVIE